jgi:acetyl esterase/lipase
MAAIRLDPHYQQAIAPYAGLVPPVPKDAVTLRRINDATIATVMGVLPMSEDTITETTLQYTSADGTALTLHRFTQSSPRPATDVHSDSNGNNNNNPQPAILYIHGGGLISGSVTIFRKDIIRYAISTGLTIYAPAYRLAPEFPFPKPVEDAYSALEWLHDHATDEGIDAARIAVMGMSAGGGLAAGVAIMARDREFSPPIAKLVLVYPMLDDRTRIADDNPLSAHLNWTGKKNEIAWGGYLGSDAGVEGAKVSPYAAPARATDVSGLPSTYIDVGGLDLFRDESLAFAARLAAANVDVELHLYPGVPHGWELVAIAAPVTKKAIENRTRALQDLLI